MTCSPLLGMHLMPGSNPGPALKLTGGPEHWLGTAPVTTTDPHTSQMAAYSLALHCVHRCLFGEMEGCFFSTPEFYLFFA